MKKIVLLISFLLISCTSKAAPPQEVEGFQLPSHLVKVKELSGAGHEGAPFTKIWFKSKKSRADLAKELESTYKSLYPRMSDTRWKNKEGVYLDLLMETYYPNFASQHSDANSWIMIYRQGKPRPCPPCKPGQKLLPGCRCP